MEFSTVKIGSIIAPSESKFTPSPSPLPRGERVRERVATNFVNNLADLRMAGFQGVLHIGGEIGRKGAEFLWRLRGPVGGHLGLIATRILCDEIVTGSAITAIRRGDARMCLEEIGQGVIFQTLTTITLGAIGIRGFLPRMILSGIMMVTSEQIMKCLGSKMETTELTKSGLLMMASGMCVMMIRGRAFQRLGDEFSRMSHVANSAAACGTAGPTPPPGTGMGTRNEYMSPRGQSPVRNIDPRRFTHPELAKQLLQIMRNPESMAYHGVLDAGAINRITIVARSFATQTIDQWALVNPSLFRDRAAKDEITARTLAQVQTRLTVIYGVTPQFIDDLYRCVEGASFLDIQQQVDVTYYTRMQTPEESALSVLHGLADRYARWKNYAWQAGDLEWQMTTRWEIQRDCGEATLVRHRVDGNFFIEIHPGVYGSASGIEYHLKIAGANAAAFGPYDLTIMTVGIIPMRDGYAIMKRQGGHYLQVFRHEGTDILTFAQKKFGNDIGADWLTRQVLRDVRMEDPEAVFYWLKGERDTELVKHLDLKIGGELHGQSLYLLANDLPTDDLMRIIGEREAMLRDGSLAIGKQERRAARHALRIIERTAKAAHAFGFESAGHESPWFILRPGDDGWRRLQETQPSDIPV